MKALIYQDVHVEEAKTGETILTGNPMLDEFWSNDGGFIKASTVLLTGTSGAGKTTLSHFVQKLLKGYKTYMYSREMKASTIKKQMRRNSIKHKNAHIADRTTVAHFDDFMKDLEIVKPAVVIVDSIQVIIDQDLDHLSPEKAALYVVNKIRQWAEDTNGTAIIIGQLNKDGVEAGSAKIKFLLDAHLEMTFDKKKNERFVEWSKNRFGKEAKLFYKFCDEGIKFYTPEQWAAAKEKLDLTDVINNSIRSYVSLIDKSSPNYKTFMKEFRKEAKNMQVVNKMKGIQLTVAVITLLQKMISKYELKAY